MNQLIEDVLTEMKIKTGLTKFELEKILDSQFKVLHDSMTKGDLREIHFKNIGKFKPTSFFIKYKNGEIKKRSQGNDYFDKKKTLKNG